MVFPLKKVEYFGVPQKRAEGCVVALVDQGAECIEKIVQRMLAQRFSRRVKRQQPLILKVGG